jgi:hypothetical protein
LTQIESEPEQVKRSDRKRGVGWGAGLKCWMQFKWSWYGWLAVPGENVWKRMEGKLFDLEGRRYSTAGWLTKCFFKSHPVASQIAQNVPRNIIVSNLIHIFMWKSSPVIGIFIQPRRTNSPYPIRSPRCRSGLPLKCLYLTSWYMYVHPYEH